MSMMASEDPATETRDTAATTPTADSQPPVSILHKTSSSESGSSSPQHHVRITASGIPPISPRLHKPALKNLHHSPKAPFPAQRKDRSMSLGAYPPSWTNLSGSLNPAAHNFVPLSPYSPSASPITSTSMYASNSSSSSDVMPCMPNLNHSGPTRAAMEAAVHSERMRTKEKEKEEVNLSADELRLVLKRERTRMSKIQADLAAMRAAAVQSQAEAEVHEEGRINNLMRRVECLQKEKGRIIVELEREEEMLTNTLQKKLDEVKREKMLLEQQIEREQTSHGELKNKLTSIRNDNKAKHVTSSSAKDMDAVDEESKDNSEMQTKKDEPDEPSHPETIMESSEEDEGEEYETE